MNRHNNKKEYASDAQNITGVIEFQEKTIYVNPTSKKNQNIYILEQDAPKSLKTGDLVLVTKLPGKRQTSRKKQKFIPCAFVKRLENNIQNNLSHIALKEHDVQVEFSEELLSYAEKKRRFTDHHHDYSHMDFITIDPETAKDHDDAVFVCPDDNPENLDGFIVYVAIADVSHYVRPDTDLSLIHI